MSETRRQLKQIRKYWKMRPVCELYGLVYGTVTHIMNDPTQKTCTRRTAIAVDQMYEDLRTLREYGVKTRRALKGRKRRRPMKY